VVFSPAKKELLKKIVLLTLLTTAIATSHSTIVSAAPGDQQLDEGEVIIEPTPEPEPEPTPICFGDICFYP
jgi:hypothetical protein